MHFPTNFVYKDVRMCVSPVMDFTAVWGSVTDFLTTRPVSRFRGLLSLSWTHETFCEQTFIDNLICYGCAGPSRQQCVHIMI